MSKVFQNLNTLKTKELLVLKKRKNPRLKKFIIYGQRKNNLNIIIKNLFIYILYINEFKFS